MKETYDIGSLLTSKQNSDIKTTLNETINKELQKFYDKIIQKKLSDFPSMPGLDKAGSHLVMDWFDVFIDKKIRKNETI